MKNKENKKTAKSSKDKRVLSKKEWCNVLKLKLSKSLKNSVIGPKGIIRNVFWDSNDGVIVFILNEKGAYMEHHDVLIHIINLVRNKILSKSEVINDNTTLIELLSIEEIESVAEELSLFFTSIPRTYNLIVELPNLRNELATNFQICEKIKAIEIFGKKADESLSLKDLASSWALVAGDGDENVQGGFYFSIQTKGFASHSFETQAILDGVATLKQALMLLRRSERIQFGFYPVTGKDLKAKIYIQDKISGEEPMRINAPDSLVEVLSKIGISQKKAEEVRTFKNKEKNSETVLGLLSGPVNPYPLLNFNEKEVQIIDSETDNINAASMKNALTWSFDSLMNSHDKTLSFIQTAIALEAVLGADSEGPNKTRLLADRCAMLISNTAETRAYTRKAFNEFYNVRSELIHGATTRLDNTVGKWLHWGQATLEKVINREFFLASFEDTKRKK